MKKFIIRLLIIFVLAFSSCNSKTKSESKAICNNEDMAVKIISKLSEVKSNQRYIDSLTQHEKGVSYIIDNVKIKGEDYYQIKTGYNGKLHWETYNIFYINKRDCNKIYIDDVLSGDKITLEEWRKNNEPEKNNMKTKQELFSELFNEGSNINFTPDDLKSDKTNIKEFKQKLDLFERQQSTKDFDVDNLKRLVNDETFTNSESFINSNWLKYFIKKYNLSLSLNDVMNSAINQEDLNAVNIVLSTGYIISKDELALALQTKENSIINKKINKENKGFDERGELIFYDDKKSKAEEIFIVLTKKYNYKIYDKDGYTNLRDDAMNSAYVLAEIKSGTHIDVIDNKDQTWLYIETSDNKKGYVHKSRIVSE